MSDIEPVVKSTSSNIPYLISILLMSLLGVIGTLSIVLLRPGEDNASLYISVASFVLPTTTALMAFLKTQETHLLVNSRMDEFKRLISINAAAAEELARVKGVAQGLREQFTIANHPLAEAVILPLK